MSESSDSNENTNDAKNQRFDDYAFNFFIGGFLLLVLIPWTVYTVRSLWKATKFDPANDVGCSCAPCIKKRKHLLSWRKALSTSRVIKLTLLCALWAVFIVVARNVFTTTDTTATPIFNPFEILEISEGSTEQEIDRAFRRQSLIWHPDKNPGNSEAMEKYLLIQKAHDTLTNELNRVNYEKYGNPDGPARIQFGIALPSWLLDVRNSPVVLLFYVGGFLLLFPGIVYLLIRQWRSVAPNEVKIDTMGMYVHFVKDQYSLKHLLDVLCASGEFKDILKVGVDDYEDMRKLEGKFASTNKSPKPGKFTAPYIVKTSMLLNAHLCQFHDTLSRRHVRDLYKILNLVPTLVSGLTTAVRLQSKELVQPMIKTIKLGQMLIQATWDDAELMQLPHFTPDVIEECSRKKNNYIRTIQQLCKLPEDKRKLMYTSINFTEQQQHDVETVLAVIPYGRVHFTCEVKVDDNEQYVSAGAITTLYVQCERLAATPRHSRYIPQKQDQNGSKKSKKDKKAQENELEPQIEDEDEDLSPEIQEQEEKEHTKNKASQEHASVPQAPAVHAPYFPVVRQEGWLLLLVDPTKCVCRSMGKTSVPTTPGAFGEAKLQFQAPLNAGMCNWELMIFSDSYLGCDMKVPVRFNVSPARKEKKEAVQTDDDTSATTVTDVEDTEEEEPSDVDDSYESDGTEEGEQKDK